MTAAAALAPGDVVRLKSGGPVMTVESLVGDGAALCCWFGYNLQHYHATFVSAMLMTVDAPSAWPPKEDDHP